MSASDDFAKWEEEVAEATESGNGKGVLITSLILLAGSGMLIALGVSAPAFAALAVFAVIVILWRAGM